MFEKSKWIARAPYPKRMNVENMPVCPYLTKDFELKGAVKNATLSIAGLGQGAYFLNGVRIPDTVRPTHPARFPVTVIYNQYDITDLLLPTNNRFGAILGNIGYCDFTYLAWRSNVKLIAQIDITYADGTSETVVSDKSWKTFDSYVLFSQTRCGEKHDANLYIDNWCSPDFDNTEWCNAIITRPPGGTLRPTSAPPIRKIREIAPTEIAPNLFDCGENMSGWAKIKVKGQQGAEIRLLYAERLNEEDPSHVCQKEVNHIVPYGPMGHTDVFILSGKEDSFEQLFSYHGFRYIEVVGEFESLELSAVVSHTDLKTVSHFECDNEMINSIYKATVRSILANAQGCMVDCPHREQHPWTGDVMLSSEAINTIFDGYDFLYEWMLKAKDEQFPSGGMPDLVPQHNIIFEYNFHNGVDWDSALIHVPYYTYKLSGNKKIIEVCWENMCRLMGYIDSISSDYLVDIGLGDFATTAKLRSNPTPLGNTLPCTAFWHWDALMMAEMAKAIGKDPVPFNELADNIKEAFRKKFMQDGKLLNRHQTALSMAIFTGLLTDEEKNFAVSDLAAMLREDDHRFFMGMMGLRTVFDALSDNGEIQTLFNTVVNDRYPGYAYAVSKGISTLTETFTLNGSLNHHFRSQVAVWMYRHLAGIRLDGFGYENVVIEPKFVDGINTLKADMRGISVEYDQSSFSVSSPYDFTLILNGRKESLKAGLYTFAR